MEEDPPVKPKKSKKKKDETTYTTVDLYQEIENNPDLEKIIEAEIYDGFRFRQLFEHLKKAVTVAPLFFMKNGILIERGNESRSLISSSFIYEDNLINYHVNSKYLANKNKYHAVNVNLLDFYQKIHNIKKKESLKLIQYKNFEQFLIIKIYGGKGSDSIDAVRIENFEPIIYQIDDGTSEDDKPNVKVPLPEFSSCCIKSAKSSSSHFKCYSDQVNLISNNSSKTSYRITPWGKKHKNEEDESFITGVSSQDLLALAKFGDFIDGGSVQIYCKGSGIIKFKTKLGSLGETSVYLIDNKKIEES